MYGDMQRRVIMSKIINDVASEYDIPTKSTIIINNDYDNSIKREDKPFIWISEEIFTLKRDKDKLQQENKQLKEELQQENNYFIQGGRGSGKTYIMKLEQQLNLYKDVIEEVREFVGSEEMYNCSFEEETNKLLQILDKVKGSDD